MNKLLLSLFFIMIFAGTVSAQTLIINATYFNADANITTGFIYRPQSNQVVTFVSQFASSDLNNCFVINNQSGALLTNHTFTQLGGKGCLTSAFIMAGQTYRIGGVRGGANSFYNNTITFPMVYPGFGNITTGCFGDNCSQNTATTLFNIVNFTVMNLENNLTFSFNSTSLETSREGFSANYTVPTATTVSSARLNYNGTFYTGTVTNVGGRDYVLSRGIDVPLITGSNPNQFLYWEINFANGSTYNTLSAIQDLSNINLSICGASPQDFKYLNYTFKNDTQATERVNASIIATIPYYLGLGTVNKTLTYINTTELKEYDFCFSPSTKPLTIAPNILYANSYSAQRDYNPGVFTIQNITNPYTLFLLPNSLGTYVTFQIINQASQSISGALVNVTRGNLGLLGTSTTSDTGLATFFLNPLTQYTVCASRSDLGQFCTTDQFTETQYTITLRGSTNATANDYRRGVSYSLFPTATQQTFGQTINFSVVFNSSYWTVSEFGFTIRDPQQNIIASNSSSMTNGYLNLSIGPSLYFNNKTLVMNLYWINNGTYTNISKIYTLVDLGNTNYSVNNFFSRLSFYLNSPDDSNGIFGLKNSSSNSFGIGLISFMAIFLGAGIFSYKYGVTSPGAVMLFIFSFTILLDVGLGLVPRPDPAIPFATVMVGITTLVVFVREWVR